MTLSEITERASRPPTAKSTPGFPVFGALGLGRTANLVLAFTPSVLLGPSHVENREGGVWQNSLRGYSSFVC